MLVPAAHSSATACSRAHGGVMYSCQLQLTSVRVNRPPSAGSENRSDNDRSVRSGC